ncbi:MAG: Lon protease [Candidatus Collierbacteria bacterium GW2011_GWC1_45_47]|uniref:Lon protease n=5 Tax=Candidatus Collieribacteriota TaxID=1752725 RepID=A0A0G1HHD0_9BACT|nr:MAG: Lon protease [Candidatus Collierbacteria bacterium GW2011_GWA1_44_12]KKT37184.1 MAG: Lon protease [Candidatus Collierbacteria bacterium GW2011_GWF1_44_12]KKT45968.1 MAG: Lon protease [Candidatus Collierbacteria bacterium GW2011_GWF2_44_15]KKT98464.1 MAG: Lon protease [Candidatus Collierbacteria bacterium GW2011_GWC2_45_15]KKU09042.1 MAG: Lon protease [Candidatus Collierbacteria bacterium GW2011_GWC1_45_47]KKU28830.1 MAG: Lon protease [Candidatus Collierbacteria bacterium GW2011_GWE1_46
MADILEQNDPQEVLFYPFIGLKEGVIFPDTEAVLTFGRPASINGITEASKRNLDVCFVSQKDPKITASGINDYYHIGTICTIIKTLPVNDELHAIVKGSTRVYIDSIEARDGQLWAQVTENLQKFEETPKIVALSNHAIAAVKKAIDLGKSNLDPSVFMKIVSASDPLQVSHQIASVLNIKNNEKQELLEEDSLGKRLNAIINFLTEEVKILELEKKIANKTQKHFDESMKEAVLRERMKTIQKELGEGGEEEEIKELRIKLKKANLPNEIYEKTHKELERLARLSIQNPESSYLRTWIETILELPWNKTSKSNYSLPKAERILNEDHYGLEKVKERIIEFIAVLKLKADQVKHQKKHTFSPPTILCFVGPPGVGKTSVGRSIAKAIGRNFVKMSLGGVKDEAEIRGHRRTYVGAMPGRIIQSIKDSGVSNPVFMLDEIDKVGADFRGDPSSALLEALDPEQNFAFQDHYLDIPYDLSQVLFITTANVLDTIPHALRDRLEVIEFSGYTEDEKFHIAKKYLIKKQSEAHALDQKDFSLSSTILRYMVRHYTREAGVRNLERQIASLMRKVARVKASGKELPIDINKQRIHNYLGPVLFNGTQAEEEDQIGLVTGMAYTKVGGDILFIEVAIMPGTGKITLTGHLGDVMKESAKAAYSYVRSHAQMLGIKATRISKSDIHIHVPEGAVPKDGPSAGLAITTALISAFSSRPVPKDLSMTGEVTLRGRALEIGGVREKVIAAHRAGIKRIILPSDNEKNMVDVPEKVKKDLRFYFVRSMDEVVKIVFSK